VVNATLVRPFELAGSRGDGRHPYVNGDGAFIGRGVPLLQRDTLGRWKPRDQAVLERLLSKGYGVSVELGWRETQLRHVAAALNDGDVALACISLLRMQLPPLPSAGHARAMAAADGLLVKDNPDWEDEPRVPAGNPDGGQWTGEGGDSNSDADAQIEPAAAQVDETRAKKERFVDAHLSDAQAVAGRLGVPVENILGLSALESGLGTSRFASEGNNFFGIHYPAPYATGYLAAERSRVRVATFASYADSLRSFDAMFGRVVRGVTDPADFAAALREGGKFGFGNPTYSRDLQVTIRGLAEMVSRRRA
jgi:hypothetical protein